LSIANDDEELPLHCLCEGNAWPAITELLINRYPEALSRCNDRGENCLTLLISSMDSPAETIYLVIDRRPELLQERDPNGRIALHHVMAKTTPKLSMEFLQRFFGRFPGNAFLCRDNQDKLPLECAFDSKPQPFSWSGKGLDALEKMIIIIDACPDSLLHRGSSGQVALHTAMKGGSLSIEGVRLLVDRSYTSLQLDDNSGRLPLHYAVECGKASLDKMRLLVARYPQALVAADPNGRLPIHFAFQRSTDKISPPLADVIKLLLEHKDLYTSSTANNHVSILNALISSPLTNEIPYCQRREERERHVSRLRETLIKMPLDRLPELHRSQEEGGGRYPFEIACEMDRSLSCIYSLTRRDPSVLLGRIFDVCADTGQIRSTLVDKNSRTSSCQPALEGSRRRKQRRR